MTEGTALGDFLGQSENPAAPEGQQQMATQAATGQPTALSAWLTGDANGGQGQQGYAGGAQSWLTGANQEGTNNGWDNAFVDAFVTEWGAALESGTARNYFDQDKATGVVTWDHTSENTGKSYHFGDVYENGKFKGNLYDDYDRDTANLMMTPWILDNDVQAQAFSASDRMDRLDREIKAAQADRNENFEKSLTALEFEGDVEAREEAFREGGLGSSSVGGDEAVVAGGALATGLLGAGVGSVLPGVGTAIGFGVGTGVGLAGSYLNRDSLTEQAARAYEITSMSYQEHGLAGGISTGVHQWSGFGGRLISPISNLSQGTYDAATGKGGDGESEFYRVDETGENRTPTWMKAIDVGATVGDSLLQFSNPVGVALYTTQMTGVVGGQVAELAANQGETFDYRSGTFDNIFTDDEGNFDLSSGAAGIGKVAIDAVQLGMARGLVGRTNALRADVGESAAYQTLGQRLGSKIPLWAGGSRGLAAGESRVRAAGFSFTRGADGAIVEGSRRATLGLLAPSEQLSALSARVMGMRAAAQRDGAYSADDFYRAAQSMAAGERRIQTALVNGFGEGYEEVVQGVLEPHSHGGSIDAGELLTAGIYGFAAGAGMTAGTNLRAPTAAERMKAQAQVAYAMNTGGAQMSDREYEALPEIEKRRLAAMAGLQRETAEAAYRKVAEDQAAEQIAGVAGRMKLEDAVQSVLSQQLARATDRTDGSFVITQLEEAPRLDELGNLEFGSVPVNAVAASAIQTAANLANHMRGLVIGRAQIRQRLDAAVAAAAADPTDTDLAEEVRQRTRQLEMADLTLDWGQKFDAALDAALDRIARTTSIPALEAEVAELNDLLRRTFNRELLDYGGVELTEDDRTALARVVSLVFVRDPQDQSGSFQVLVPQVSARLTEAGADNVLEISHAILPAIRGDYDGDKIRQQAQLIFDDNEFAAARSGAHFIGAGTSVNVGAPKYERYIVDYLAESFAGNNLTLQTFAQETLNSVATAIRGRYAGVIDGQVLDEVLAQFFAAVRANDKDSRATLMDGLAELAGGEITAFGRENLSSEWLWIDQLIVSTFQRFQESYAAHRPDIGPEPSREVVSPVHQSPDVRTRRASMAATYGQSLANFAAGDSLFRKFQKLHYSVIGSPVLTAEGLEPTSLTEMAMLYRELGQGVTRTEIDVLRSKDDITGRVLAQLNRLAEDFTRLNPTLNKRQAMVVVANLKVQNLDIAEDGTVTDLRNQISLTQMLLKQSLMQDRREKAQVWDASPELQAKHAKLMQMTRPNSRDYATEAEQAFVEVIGAQQLYTLLGDDASAFGPHLTVEQFIRQYSSLNEYDRRDVTRKLHTDAAYLGKARPKDMPYELDDVGDISPLRAVVDAVLAVGNGRIAIDAKTGKLVGEIAERSDQVSENFREAHTQVRQALQQFAGLSPRQDGELTVDVVARMLEGNPDFARSVMNLVPNAAANAAFEVRDGQVYVANWLFETFAMADAKAAEMHYWRNLVIAQWRAKGVPLEEEGEDGEHARTYSRLERRIHRVMYRLAAHPDGGLLYQSFIRNMEQATDLENFIRWVNTTPGIRGEQAPLTAWVDDTAEFDADKAQGGWTTALAGAELRESIATLRQRSESLVGTLVAEKTALNNDVRARAAIRRVIKKDAGDTSVTLDAGDRDLYNRFVKAIDFAGDWYVSAGPNAMIFQTVGAVHGFYAQAHTKGKNPPNVEPAGSLDAYRDAFDYVTNYERLMGSLTSVNLDAVGANLPQVAKDAGRTMDDHGRTVEWSKPTPQQMLDLLEDPDSRPFARAMLFPQVMERDFNGVMRPQLLIGKSLSDLLRGVSHKDLFPRNGRLSQESALKYISMIEGVARKYGGHFSVQRALNDIVIARTSAADHLLSVDEIETMTVKAAHEVAMVLQAVGSIASQPRDPGSDPLGDMLAEVRATQRRLRTARTLGLEASEDEIDAAVVTLITQREKQHADDVKELAGRIKADPANEQTYLAQINAANEELDRFKFRVELLRTDDVAGQVVEMFTITGDATEQATRKQAVAEYILTHMSMIERSSATMVTLTKFTQQMMDPARNGQPSLSDKEWEELSRAVIGVYLDDVSSTTAAGGSVSPWPDADRVQDQKYFDTSWSYLVEDLMRADGPLAQAAGELASSSYRPPVTRVELYELLGRTILDGDRLGPWTGDIPRASIEANARLDSSAAAPAIAIAGNSPKRQAAIMASTRRTFLKPDESLLSTARLGWTDLKREAFDEVDISLANVGQVRRPLAQLNNRFAKSATLEIVDAEGVVQSYDLLALAGRPWMGHDSVRDSGYQEIHLERLLRAVDRVAGQNKVDPAAGVVNIEFFHPDSQPETVEGGPNWHNNVYFEGTSFKLDADRHESLISTLWFTQGSISPENQAAALDASKLGVSALQVIETVPAAERMAIEANWSSDLGAALRAKTQRLIETDLGFGNLDLEFYNAVYKDMKIRHFVLGVTPEGERLMWTSEQVIAFQLANPGAPLPFDNAELWVPTDDVLRSLHGEQGTQGAVPIYENQLEFDPSRIPVYRGVTQTMLDRFNLGIAGERLTLPETRVVNRGRQAQLTVRPMVDQAAKSAFDAKMLYFRERQDDIWKDRHERATFDPAIGLAAAIERGRGLMSAETLTLHWGKLGIPFGPRKPEDTQLSKNLLQNVASAMEADQFRTGWVYREGSKSQPQVGLISEVSLGGSVERYLRIAPGDLVVVELDSFGGDKELAKKRVDYLANNGAIIVLGASDGQADIRTEVAEYLVSDKGYDAMAGSNHAFSPAEYGSRYQNPRARASTLTEMEGVSTKSRVITLSVQGLPIQEGAAWVNSDNERLGAVAVTANLVPTGSLAGFNVPVEQFSNLSQIEAVRDHLRGLDTEKGRAFLKEQANRKLEGEARVQADVEFDLKFTEMMDRFNVNPGVVLPQPGDTFGTGDMIPLVNATGQILIYRHGHKAPRRDQIEEMTGRRLPDSLDAVNVAVYPSTLEPAATTHIGEVVEFRPRAGYGLEVELNIPLQLFGDKKQLELNGMKYVLVPKPDSLVLPQHGIFPEWGIDMISDLDTLLGKEAVADMVNNHRNAFVFFGIDFLPDVTEFFFPGQRDIPSAQAKAREMLHIIATRVPRIPERAADELINADRLGAAFAEQLPVTIAAGVEGIDPGWVNRLADLTPNEHKITAAIVTYLMTPGARVDDVLSSGGFNSEGSTSIDMQSRRMPRLFTQIFDNAPLGSALRSEINERLNKQIYNPNNDGTGYRLHQDFTFEVRNARSAEKSVTYKITDNPQIDYRIVDGMAVAFVGTQPVARMTWGAKTGEIGDIAVLPEHRRKGIASGLLKFVRDQGFQVTHSTMRTPAGEAWARAQDDGPLPEILAMPEDEAQAVADLQAVLKRIKPLEPQEVATRAGKNLRGFLTFAQAHSSGDNPVKNGMSFDESERAAVSAHSAAIVYGATGAETAYAHDISRARTFAEGKGIERDLADGGAWRMLTDIPLKDRTFNYWRASSPAEAVRRDLSREAMIQFRQPIVKDADHNWDPRQIKQYQDLVHSITRQLGLLDVQGEVVDFWVRQILGQPFGEDSDHHDLGRVTGKGAIEAAQDILWNVENHYLPIAGAEVPALHLHDLQMIFRANRNRSNPWNPRESMDRRSTNVTDWKGWTEVALGNMLTSDTLFDPLYLLALDGFMHTYQNATRSLMDLPVSADALVSQKLMDPDLNRMLTSVSDPVNVQVTEPLILDAARATLESVIGGQRIAGKFQGKAAPASEVAKRRAARRKWRKENGVPLPVDVSLKNFRKNGANFVDEATTTNAFVRVLIQLRLGTALLNPALYLSMGPEQWIRGALDRAANLLTGQATVGATARLQARTSERLEGTAVGAGLEALGVKTRYTPEQLGRLRQLYMVLGQRNDFRGMLYHELKFDAPHAPGRSRIERGFEAYGRLGLAAQDPTYGMRSDTLARRYIEAALQSLEFAPTTDVISTDMFIAQMMTNPLWLQKNHLEIHKRASAAVAQIRSMKHTVLGQTLRGIYEPLSDSSHAGRNMFGNLLLKIPMLFSNYAMNVATTILGLQGLDQMTAMFLHGRQKGPKGWIGRVQGAMRGRPEASDDVFDMDDVIESIDLSRAFIRGGLTHTGLFAFGLMAGGLGLSGEDDEMRKRRLMAEHQGLGNIYDPRRIENDFRNADAIYLDALPFGFGNLFEADGDTERAIGQPHWMVKQFLSPVIGMEKFFETGDTRHITWGFQDALGAFPLVNTMMWQDVVETGDMLAADADQLAKSGNPEDLVESAGALTRMVGTYERMLFENSFVNQLYIGYDRYDRDPYVLPLRDSDKDLQGDIEGNTRPQNIALTTFIDPETGKPRQGYLGRSDASTQAHVLAENRATFAFVASLFTGGPGDSDYIRYNMPIKTREIAKEPLDIDEAKAYVLGAAAFAARNQPNVTVEEILPQVRNELYKIGDQTGKFYTEEEVHAVAEQFVKSQGGLQMSLIDDVGREHLTDDGAVAVMRGLVAGSVRFGDPALQGVYITREQREKIQADWAKELVQEGLELGLDKTKAVSRMKRVLYGPIDNPQVPGLADILWAPENELSYNDSQTYAQLNTTYVMGPDGRPWATGFERDKFLSAMGLPPVKRMIVPEHGGVGVDLRMNTVDLVAGMNTGLRALEPLDDSRNVPTDKEIGDSIIKAIEDAAKADYTPFKPFENDGGGNGYKGYGGFGGYGGGGGGGGAYFTRMYGLPANVTPYGNSAPFINTSNPIIRRAIVRRERVWSERGRLKQWQ